MSWIDLSEFISHYDFPANWINIKNISKNIPVEVTRLLTEIIIN